ncbi:complex I subunit 4 family protein [Sulfuriroseicoccus oceanibius]|uniref:NADH-quinone oxidoreductase subunit M n=1 Tax=Sulfuriroseicoccus oceanibius TaxID=2707525 RepID=A0A6B3LB12_9BACT|nr:NADH-quinone oxidoreductase subunit M [Sulfuriroseicoccus oceanibius]QQL44272.1 NADH-quinone oxidoreductase subunit M [Sulfuriroseicoccus oceanibius]
MSAIPVIILLLPILAAIAIGLRAPARNTALLAAIANVALTAVLCFNFDQSQGTGDFQFTSSLLVLQSPEISLAFGVDGMSLIMVLLTVIVTLAALWSIKPQIANERLHYISSLLIAAGGLGAFLSTDVFFFYAFHELALIPTFLMIGLCGRGENPKRVAWTITLYLALGSLVLLAGIVALVLNSGGSDGGLTFSMSHLLSMGSQIDPSTQKWIAALLLVGFGTLVSLFPFHSWAAPAYAAAPTSVSMLHAGVLKKFGLYGLIRLAVPLLPEGMAEWTNVLLVLLLCNILYVGLVTVAQRRLDLMLGNSSVMHMGYIFLGIAALISDKGPNPIATNGAVLLMFAHGVSIALLFALAGKIEERTGRLEHDTLGGLAKKMPSLGFLFGLAAFASIGLPGFANFAGEVAIFVAAFAGVYDGSTLTELGNLQWAAIAAFWGVVISAVYMLRSYRSIFMGEEPKGGLEVDGRLTLDEKLPLGMLAAALLVVGFFPNIILQYLN